MAYHLGGENPEEHMLSPDMPTRELPLLEELTGLPAYRGLSVALGIGLGSGRNEELLVVLHA